MPTELRMLATGTVFIEIALVIFMVVFMVILAWVVLSQPGKYRRAARIPLEDDVVTPRADHSRRRPAREGDAARSETDLAKEHDS